MVFSYDTFTNGWEHEQQSLSSLTVHYICRDGVI